jgi:hypothetical protein
MMSDDRVLELIRVHLERYPQSGFMDIYKLLHQATFGPGHAITGKKEAKERLEHELKYATLPNPGDYLLENVHPEGQIVRLHLRPYAAFRGSTRPLLDAFIRSADDVRGTVDVMVARWHAFEQSPYIERFPSRELALFARFRAQEGWPAVHHSPTYQAVYHPVYRVLTRAEAQTVCEKIKAPFEVI